MAYKFSDYADEILRATKSVQRKQPASLPVATSNKFAKPARIEAPKAPEKKYDYTANTNQELKQLAQARRAGEYVDINRVEELRRRVNRNFQTKSALLDESTNRPDRFVQTPVPTAQELFPGPYNPQTLAQLNSEIEDNVLAYDKTRQDRIKQLQQEQVDKAKSGNFKLTTNLLDANTQQDRINRLQRGEDEVYSDVNADGESRGLVGQTLYKGVGALGEFAGNVSAGTKSLLGSALETLPDGITAGGADIFNTAGKRLQQQGIDEAEFFGKSIDESRFSMGTREGESAFLGNLSAGAAQLGLGIAATAANPFLATTLYGISAGGEQQRASQEAGASPWQSLMIGSAAGLTEGLLESKLNMKFLEGTGKGLVSNMIMRAGTEGFQEGAQSIGQSGIASIYQDVDFSEAWKQAFIEAGYGAILGGPGSISLDMATKISTDKNLQNKIKENVRKQAETIKNKVKLGEDGYIQVDSSGNQKEVDVELFHGSPAAKQIFKEGFKPPATANGQTYGRGIYLANDDIAGKVFGGPSGEFVTASLDKDAKILRVPDPQVLFNKDTNFGDPQLITDKYQKQGYDGLEIGTTENGREFVIFDPSKITVEQVGKNSDLYEKNGWQKKARNMFDPLNEQGSISAGNNLSNNPIIQEASRFADGEEFYNRMSKETRNALRDQGIRGFEQVDRFFNDNVTPPEPILDTLNPTGGVFVDYTPSLRATIPLGNNMTTIDRTLGGSPDDRVTVYRGTNEEFSQNEIQPGDFVTTLPELARSYAGDGRIISKEVRKGDLLDDSSPGQYSHGEETIYRPNADKEVGGFKVNNPLDAKVGPKELFGAALQSSLGKTPQVSKTPLGTSDKYVYHADSTNSDINLFRKNGILPSREGQSGPGLYLANTEDATEYNYSSRLGESPTMYRVDKQVLIDRYGLYNYQNNPDGQVQFDETTGEIYIEGQDNIPPELIEVKQNGKWKPLTSKTSRFKLGETGGYDGGLSESDRQRIANYKETLKNPKTEKQRAYLEDQIYRIENQTSKPKQTSQSKFTEGLDAPKTSLKFIESAKASDQVSPEAKKKLRTRRAETITNKETLEQARKDISKQGFEAAVTQAKTSDQPTVKIQAKSLELITQLQEQGRHDDAVEIIRQYSERARTAGQATQIAAAINRLTPTGMVMQAESLIRQAKKENPKQYGDLELNPEDAQRIKEMTENALTLEGDARTEALMEIQEEIARLVPTPAATKAVTLWKAGLLTGIKGGVFGNAVGNSSMGLLKKISDAPATALDVAISRATGQRSKSFTLRGLFSGALKGGKVGFENFMAQRGGEDLEIKFDKTQTFYSKSRLGRAAQLYTDSVFNFYSAADKPFYYAALENTLRDRASVEAKNQGLTGKERTNFIENLVANPTEDMNVAAVKDALTIVFQNRNAMTDSLTGFKQGLARATKQKGSNVGEVIGEALLPFTGVPSNVALATYNYTPIPGVKKTYNAIKNSNEGKFTQEQQRELVESLGRGMTGTGVMWLGYQLALSGMLTLGWPSDDDERALWEREGKTPWSIKIGGKWRSLNYAGPVLTLMSIGGAVSTDGVVSGVATAPSAIVGSSPLQGVQGALDVINDPERNAGRYFNNLAGSTVPTIVKDIAVAIDPLQRDVDNPIEAVMARIPWLRGAVDPKVDKFGYEKERDVNPIEAIIDPLKSSPVKSDPLTSEIRRLYDEGILKDTNVIPPRVTESSWGYEKDQMSDDQKEAIMKAVYPEIAKRYEEIIVQKTYQGLSDTDKVKLLEKERDAILSTRREEFKALSDDDERSKWIMNGQLQHIDSKVKSSEGGFLDMLWQNAQAWGSDPVTAFKYLGSEKIRRTDNGQIIVYRGDDSDKIREELGATDEVELDHIVPLQLGGDNSRDNLELIDIETHKEYTKYGNEVAKRMRAGVMSKSEARETFLKLRNGEMQLSDLTNPTPGGVERPDFKPSKDDTSTIDDDKNTLEGVSEATEGNYYQDRYNKAVEKLKDGNLTSVEKFELQDEIETLEVRKNFPRDVVKLYDMSKADAYEFLSTTPGGDKLADQLVAYGDAMVAAGVWDYSKYRDKNGVVSIEPKGSSSKRSSKSGGSSSKKKKGKFDYNVFATGTSPVGSSQSLQQILEQTLKG